MEEKTICVGCGEEKLCRHSLPVKRDNGSWKAQPLCPQCRRALLAEAREINKVVRIFSLESSLREIKKRNGNLVSLAPLLERYARDFSEKQSQSPTKQGKGKAHPKNRV